MKNQKLLDILSFILLVVLLVFLLFTRYEKGKTAADCPVVDQALAALLVPAATPTLEAVQPVVVGMVEKGETTYMYRLDEFGHAIWRVAGEIPPGALVKRSGCWADGFAQVEYRDPSRPNRWLVLYVKCGE